MLVKAGLKKLTILVAFIRLRGRSERELYNGSKATVNGLDNSQNMSARKVKTHGTGFEPTITV